MSKKVDKPREESPTNPVMSFMVWVIAIIAIWLFLEYQANKWVVRDCPSNDRRCQCVNEQLMKEFGVTNILSDVFMTENGKRKRVNAASRCRALKRQNTTKLFTYY